MTEFSLNWKNSVFLFACRYTIKIGRPLQFTTIYFMLIYLPLTDLPPTMNASLIFCSSCSEDLFFSTNTLLVKSHQFTTLSSGASCLRVSVSSRCITLFPHAASLQYWLVALLHIINSPLRRASCFRVSISSHCIIIASLVIPSHL